jgi:ankyrin repeat protein
MTKQTKNEMFEEIKLACTRKYISSTKRPDIKRNKDVFMKYFNPKNPKLNINSGIDKSGFTPLMTVVWLGHKEEAQELLKLGAKASFAPNGLSTPIHIAAQNERLPIMDAIVKNNKNIINIQNKDGQTPLMLAAETGNLELVKKMIETYNANPIIADNKNKTALDYAIKNKKHSIESYLKYYILNSQIQNDKKDHKVSKI